MWEPVEAQIVRRWATQFAWRQLRKRRPFVVKFDGRSAEVIRAGGDARGYLRRWLDTEGSQPRRSRL